jgi:RNA polymerase sigma-70 factor (ECF subfamily)
MVASDRRAVTESLPRGILDGRLRAQTRRRERGSGLLSDGEFDDLYRRHRGGVYRAIRGLVLDGRAVEDLAHDTFQRAWCERARWADGTEAVTQVYRIAVRLALARARRRRLLDLACPWRPVTVGGDAAGTVVGAALAELTPRQRTVLVLAHYAGLDRTQIGAVLGLPSREVGARLADALAAMRELIAVQEEGSHVTG